jgi:hypothetical protein
VLNAQLCGDKPTESDSTLYPSDHIGVKVTLRISPKASSSSSSSSAGGVGAEGDEGKVASSSAAMPDSGQD